MKQKSQKMNKILFYTFFSRSLVVHLSVVGIRYENIFSYLICKFRTLKYHMCMLKHK